MHQIWEEISACSLLALVAEVGFFVDQLPLLMLN